MKGLAAIENGVRLRFADQIHLGRNVYLDQGVYLHACPDGIAIGDNSFVMHGAMLHVYNFRDLPHAFIRIGRDSLIGEMNVLRGQGGITIGDRVYTAPWCSCWPSIMCLPIPTGPWSNRASRPRASWSRTMCGSAPAPSSPMVCASAKARWWRPAPW